jgi:glycogen operon protein
VEPEGRNESLCQLLREGKNSWHGVKLNQPDWGHWSHSLALTAEVGRERLLLHLILNAYWEPLDFELPPVDDEYGPFWRRWIDTSVDSPNDIVPWKTAPAVPHPAYRAEARSVVVLIALAGE